MKFNSIRDVKNFISVVNNCSGNVWLESVEGDRYNLKSTLSQYVAIGDLVRDHGEKLELFASLPEDRVILMDFISTLE